MLQQCAAADNSCAIAAEVAKGTHVAISSMDISYALEHNLTAMLLPQLLPHMPCNIKSQIVCTA